MNNLIKCHGCKHFYITYKQSKPYGCRVYGFISKILPSKVVFDTSGIKCAYKIEIKGL
jgi:hypothetical protein